MTDQTDGHTRRTVLAALMSVGAVGASSTTAAADEIGIGGGDMSDELSHLAAQVYSGPADDLDEPGVEGRFFQVTEANQLWNEGDILEDTGTQWRKLDINLGSLSVDEARTDLLENREVLNTRLDSQFENTHYGEQVIGFEDLDSASWDVGSGTMTADEDEIFIGTQSALCEASNDSFTADYSFENPVDLSDYDLSVAIKSASSDETESLTPLVRFNDQDDGWDFLNFATAVNPDRHGQRWERHDLGLEADNPDVDTTSIDGIRISHGPRDQIKFWIDDIRLIPKRDRGAVITTWDDNNADDWDVFEIFGEYGLTASFAVNGSTVGDSQRLTLEQMRTMYERGFEFVNHTWEHKDARDVSVDEYEEDVRRGKEWLLENDFLSGANFFVYPHGGHTPDSRDAVSRYHTIGCILTSSEYGGLSGTLTNPQLANRTTLDGQVSTAIRAIEWAEKHNMYVHLYGHSSDVSNQDIRDIAEAIDNADVDCLRLSDQWRESQTMR